MAGNNGNGRKKGTPNKNTQSIIDKLAELGCDPLDGMAKIAALSMEAKDYGMALQAFKELGQYVAPKRKSIEMTGEMGLDMYANIMIGFRDIPIDTD